MSQTFYDFITESENVGLPSSLWHGCWPQQGEVAKKFKKQKKLLNYELNFKDEIYMEERMNKS